VTPSVIKYNTQAGLKVKYSIEQINN